MLSLTQFRIHLFQLLKIMGATGLELEIVHRGKVYDIHVTPTDKAPKLSKQKRLSPAQVIAITTDSCPECASLSFNNICMNPRCIHSTGKLANQVEKLV